MRFNNKIGDKIKLLKNNLNLPISPYKHTSRDIKDNQTDNYPAKKKTPCFKELFQVPNEVKEAIYLTEGGIIK